MFYFWSRKRWQIGRGQWISFQFYSMSICIRNIERLIVFSFIFEILMIQNNLEKYLFKNEEEENDKRNCDHNVAAEITRWIDMGLEVRDDGHNVFTKMSSRQNHQFSSIVTSLRH